MSINDLPPNLREEGVILIQPGNESPKITIKLNDADIEQFTEVFAKQLKGA